MMVLFLHFNFKNPYYQGGKMFLFIFGLFVGCSLGVFLISILVKSKEADGGVFPSMG
jgi:hypothetical protein